MRKQPPPVTHRFIVTFLSTTDGSGAYDITAFDVTARSELHAIAKHRNEVSHPWSIAKAMPWPAAWRDIDAAIDAISAATGAS